MTYLGAYSLLLERFQTILYEVILQVVGQTTDAGATKKSLSIGLEGFFLQHPKRGFLDISYIFQLLDWRKMG